MPCLGAWLTLLNRSRGAAVVPVTALVPSQPATTLARGLLGGGGDELQPSFPTVGFIFLNQSVVDLGCGVNFCCIVK